MRPTTWMTRAQLALIAVIAVGTMATLAPRAAEACAGCRNPTLPQRPGDAGPLDSRWFLTIAASSTTVDVSHPAGCENIYDCSAVPIQPAHTHELFIVPLQVAPSITFAASERVGLELTTPVRMVHTNASYSTPEGDAYTPIDAGVHHRDETLWGLSDARVAARYATQIGAFWLTTRVGTTVPIGRTEPDPFLAGDAGEEHQHIQFGSGTFEPTLGFNLTRGTTFVQWSAYAQGQLGLYENRHGFRAPARGLVGTSADYRTMLGHLFGASLEVSAEGPERWQGRIEQDASLGRTEILFGPQASVAIGASMHLFASVRFVLYRDIVEGDEPVGDLASPAAFSLGASWAL